MRKACFFLAFLCLSLAVLAQNPISPPGVYIADPTSRVGLDGRLYIYGSLDLDPKHYCSDRYHVLSSADLKDWTLHSDSFRWESTIYAPDMMYKDGTYYLYFENPRGDEFVAVSDSPVGPFRDAVKIEGPKQIDPNIFIDDDGQAYYFWGQFSAKGAKMNPDLKTLDLSSMVDGIVTEKDHHFHEGSYVIKRGKYYYFIYADISRNGRPTCLGYSMSTSPLGPYEYKGVIIDNAGCDPETWNNHGSLVKFGDRWYVLYHRSTHASRSMRKACIEPISFNEDGTIDEVEMTSQGAGAPLDAFSRTDAARACLMGGNVRIRGMEGTSGSEELGGIRSGDSAVWKYLDFGKGARLFTVHVRSGRGGTIRLLEDGEGGRLLGSIDVPSTSGWITVSSKVSRIKGVHALRMEFEGPEGGEDLFSLDWFSFSESGEPSLVQDMEGLAGMFVQPPMEYRPYVWWHWMGPNFSKEGIRRDLEAMKEAGIAGATIFNLTSAVQESEQPIGNNPWPDQEYRSPKYWEAIEYAAEVARELGLKIGLHNSPGYSTTGGPWISEDQGMQKVVMSKVSVDGGGTVRVSLPVPELPSFSFYTDLVEKAGQFHDIAVMAVPAKDNPAREEVVDLTGKMDPSGILEWNAPAGKWTLYRIGHACTMAFPHPVPEDVLGKTLEADKMNAEISSYHWDNVLAPLKEHVGKYFGDSFTHLLIDSYEAGDQNWTEGFREKFKEMNGYDPVPGFALKDSSPEGEFSKRFDEDMKRTVSRMFIDNGFRVARDKINAEGLQLFWEPYSGPFDTAESVSLADLPMGEFWTYSSGRISRTIVDKAREYGKNIVGAEAFTGWPTDSHYTEDPEFLKNSADGAFVSGANLLFLHHWVHQPFDDRYQPGMGMGWWGTHFGRNQTWFEPGKAFFTYLSRCQMMLRQRALEDLTDNWIRRKTPDSDIFFAVNQGKDPVTLALAPSDPSIRPEYWDPYSGKVFIAPDSAVEDSVRIRLAAGQSMFVVLPRIGTFYQKESTFVPKSKAIKPAGDVWDVTFVPKVDDPFSIKSFRLQDFSRADEERIRYFSGTATYSLKISLGKEDIAGGKRVLLDLGELNDIAKLAVNGREVAVLWYPPYRADITDFVKKGNNLVEVAVTNNWANRLIGDEQYEPDFEWGKDRGDDMGRAVKEFPEWFLKGEPRPSKGRKAFAIWSYFKKDSPLQPAGLTGPVRLIIEEPNE